jgi:hypothetical protein
MTESHFAFEDALSFMFEDHPNLRKLFPELYLANEVEAEIAIWCEGEIDLDSKKITRIDIMQIDNTARIPELSSILSFFDVSKLDDLWDYFTERAMDYLDEPEG